VSSTGIISLSGNIVENCFAGVSISDPTSINVSGNQFTGNGSLPLYVSGSNPIVVANVVNQSAGPAAPAIAVNGSSLNLNELVDNYSTGSVARGLELSGVVTTGGVMPYDSSWSLVEIAGLVVPSGVAVSIMPGTVVKSFGGSVLDVEGTLSSTGAYTSPVVFTSMNDNSVGGVTGSGSPKPGNWSGVKIGAHELSTSFNYTVFEYADAAVQVGLLDVLPITNSVFSYNNAAITVQGTADDNPILGALDCVPPYLSVIDASTDYFGTSGYPGASIDLLGLLGTQIPEEFSSEYGAVSSYMSAEFDVQDNTVPWSVYSCPLLFETPIPLTPVVFNSVPVYPLYSVGYKE
jgi:hypothetical protein